MWALIQHDYLYGEDLIATKYQTATIWWTKMIQLTVWTQVLKLWDSYTEELDGSTLQHCTNHQCNKLVTKICQYCHCCNELLVSDQKWLMDDPSQFIHTVTLPSLHNWLNIYKPVLTESFKLAQAVTTSNIQLVLTSYFTPVSSKPIKPRCLPPKTNYDLIFKKCSQQPTRKLFP